MTRSARGHCAFPIDSILESRIGSLRNNPRYRDAILSYFRRLNRENEHLILERRYDLVLSRIRELWVNSQKNPSIFRTAKDFEPILQRIPQYRDHFIHSFNVFVLGYYLINRLKEILHDYDFKTNDPNLTWMLAATYHDVAYPVQELESWLNELLEKFLGVNPLIRFRYSIAEILPLIYSDFMRMISAHHRAPRHSPIGGGTSSIDWLFYDKINSKLLQKDHGVLGALMLAHQLAIREGFIASDQRHGGYGDFLMNHLPACHAIAVHNLEEIPLELTKHPLALLLVLCDELQDWGRPSKKANMGKIDLCQVQIDNIRSHRPKIQFEIQASKRRRRRLYEALSGRIYTDGAAEIVIMDTEGETILQARAQPDRDARA